MTQRLAIPLVAGLALAVAVSVLPITSARAQDTHASEVGIGYHSAKPMMDVGQVYRSSVRIAPNRAHTARQRRAAPKRRYLAREGNTVSQVTQ